MAPLIKVLIKTFCSIYVSCSMVSAIRVSNCTVILFMSWWPVWYDPLTDKRFDQLWSKTSSTCQAYTIRLVDWPAYVEGKQALLGQDWSVLKEMYWSNYRLVEWSSTVNRTTWYLTGRGRLCICLDDAFFTAVLDVLLMFKVVQENCQSWA